MEPSCLETTDIFRGAFFLCHGGRLAQVRLKEDARRIVSFLIEGDNIDQLDIDYRNGLALVNPLQFRETLNHLRDILFNKLREKERRYDEKYVEDPAKGGNRKREDRNHKKKR